MAGGGSSELRDLERRIAKLEGGTVLDVSGLETEVESALKSCTDLWREVFDLQQALKGQQKSIDELRGQVLVQGKLIEASRGARPAKPALATALEEVGAELPKRPKGKR